MRTGGEGRRKGEGSTGRAYANLLLSHGISTAIFLYLAYRGGLWLDRRFGTEPWLLAASILLMAATTLRMTIRDVLQLSEQESRRRRGGGGGSPRDPGAPPPRADGEERR